MAGKGIILTEDFDIEVLNGSMIIGDSEMQETAVILSLNQGDLKFKPVLGPNLIQLNKVPLRRFDFEQRARVHLALDGKDYETIKNKLLIQHG